MSERLWEKIRPVEGADGYFVTDDGTVFSERVQGPPKGKRGPRRKLKLAIDAVGRPSVWIPFGGSYQRVLVGVLVAAAFIGARPPGLDVMHRDGDPANNRDTNLSYGTRKENMADREAHGRTARGTRNARSRLTDEQVRAIRVRLTNGEGLRAIARDFGITHPTVMSIRDKKAWTHVV